MRSKEEILADIDVTLDQLIQNADALHHVPLNLLDQTELDALQKTQESLLARLLHRDQLLGESKTPVSHASISAKIETFSRLNAKLMHDVARRFQKPKKPTAARRRKSEIIYPDL